MKTDCSKCGSLIPVVTKGSHDQGVMGRVKFIMTGYVCKTCGKSNDLKRRKGFKEWADQQ